MEGPLDASVMNELALLRDLRAACAFCPIFCRTCTEQFVYQCCLFIIIFICSCLYFCTVYLTAEKRNVYPEFNDPTMSLNFKEPLNSFQFTESK